MGDDPLSQDHFFMGLALEQAHLAECQGEVPVGAVIVKDGQIIGAGFNQPISSHDSTAHAEIIAIRQATNNQKNYRIPGSTLYVTLEPCLMCAGAILQSRIERVVFACREPKTGAAGSILNVFDNVHLNHHASLTSGVREQECAHKLKTFFARRRAEQKNQKTSESQNDT